MTSLRPSPPYLQTSQLSQMTFLLQPSSPCLRTSQLLLRTSRLPLPIIPILSATFLTNLLHQKLHQQRALNASVLLPPLRPLQVTNTTSTESTYWWFYAQRKNCQRWNI